MYWTLYSFLLCSLLLGGNNNNNSFSLGLIKHFQYTAVGYKLLAYSNLLNICTPVSSLSPCKIDTMISPILQITV